MFAAAPVAFSERAPDEDNPSLRLRELASPTVEEDQANALSRPEPQVKGAREALADTGPGAAKPRRPLGLPGEAGAEAGEIRTALVALTKLGNELPRLLEEMEALRGEVARQRDEGAELRAAVRGVQETLADLRDVQIRRLEAEGELLE